MSSEQSTSTYQTYLLRLRRRMPADDTQPANRHTLANSLADTDMPGGWQLILVHPYTGAKRTFDSLEALTLFLQEQMKDSE